MTIARYNSRNQPTSRATTTIADAATEKTYSRFNARTCIARACFTLVAIASGASALAQTGGNNQLISGPTVVFGGQTNGQLIQGQNTLTNIVVVGPTTAVTTTASGNSLGAMDTRSFTSSSGTLGGMQVNSGTINATTEFVSANGPVSRYENLVSNNRAAGNAASFGSTTTGQLTTTLNLERQVNTGNVLANTNASGIDASGNSATRSVQTINSATANDLRMFNTSSASGAQQLNTGTVTGTASVATTGQGTLTNLTVSNSVTGNNMMTDSLSNLNLSNSGGNGVQNNGGAITATTNVSNTAVSGATTTRIETFGSGNSMDNRTAGSITHSGSADRGLQNNAGSVSVTSDLRNFTSQGGLVEVNTMANGNRLVNIDVVSFQQGTGNNPSNQILQENAGTVAGKTTLYNTNFGGDLTINTSANGNSAAMVWTNAGSANNYVAGSQVNSGQVSAITTWTFDPTRSVTINTSATGNNMYFGKSTP